MTGQEEGCIKKNTFDERGFMALFKKMALKLIVIGTLILIQIAVLVILVFRVAVSLPIVIFISWLLGAGIVYWLVRKDEPSAYRVAWIIIIMSIPSVGGILYLVFEENLHVKRMDARINKEHNKLVDLLREDGKDVENDSRVSSRMKGCSHYVQRASSYHPYKNTSSKYYHFGEFMFEDMLVDMKNAQKFIFVEYFIIAKSNMWDRMLEVLEGKAAQGVDVRLIVDDLGGSALFTRSYVKQVRETGVKVVRFNPMTPVLSLFMNNRNHRKMLIIDGDVAFNGGINISDEYINQCSRLGVWKDAGVRLEGEAISSFTHMFIKLWNTSCKQNERINNHMEYKSNGEFESLSDGLIMPYDDSPLDNEQVGENVYIDILNQAQRYVYIFTPYLIIGENMIYALKMAAKRGIDVRIVTPGNGDSKIVHRLTRSYYEFLLKSGVRIYEYTPGFMHSKNFVSDDEIAVVGTINLDYRSLYLHFECATLFYKSSTIKDMKEDAVNTFAESREIMLSGEKQHIGGKLLDAVFRLLAPLM